MTNRPDDGVPRYPVIDFDPFTEPRPAGGAHAILDNLREKCPAFRSAPGSGFWVLTRYDDIVSAYHDPALFSSRAVAVIDPEPTYRWIPEMLDPPAHTAWRRLLRPLFTPARAASMRERIRQRCTDLIDGLATHGSCDFVADFARRYPASIFLELMGLPPERLDEFLEWEYAILHPAAPGEERMAAMGRVSECFAELIARRRRQPRDDLVSAAVAFEIDGRPVPDADLLQLCVMLFLAGLDTVAAQLSYTFWHLATHKRDRERIVTQPGIIPRATEEFLRAYPLALPARKVTRDTEIHGCPMKAGDMVMLPITMATRDPRVFSEPDVVDFDRPAGNHVAFGAGPHRCLGAHLARQELQIALREWHARIPDYVIAGGARVLEHASLVLGLDGLPLVWPG